MIGSREATEEYTGFEFVSLIVCCADIKWTLCLKSFEVELAKLK